MMGKKSARTIVALVGLQIAFCLQAILALPRLSATVDEPTHLAAGYSYWQTRDFQMNPEHPPLAKLLAALPLLLIHPRFAPSKADAGGEPFLYANEADRLLFWARLPMIILASAGLVVTFLWAWDLFGLRAGLFAATMFAFSPNLIGHGMLITTDVPLAVFTSLTLYLFWKQTEHPSLGSNIPVGLALGGAMVSKFSGGVFLPVLLAVLSFVRSGRSCLKHLSIMACASLLVIEASYLFSASPLLYFQNALLVNANHISNYPVYLFGQLKSGGWWYYFLAAFAVKATIPTMLLLLLTSVHAMTGWVNRWGETILLTAVCSFVVLTSVAADQIGVRYLLPIFPLVFIWSSRIVPYFARLRTGLVLLIVLLLWQASSALHAFPNYIPYFNELAGGAVNGPRLLDDSNVDWGQGVKQAAAYVRNHRIQGTNVYVISPFGNAQYYGLPRSVTLLAEVDRLFAGGVQPGMYIISTHSLARMATVNPAWHTLKPVDRIAESLWVYVF